MTWSWVTHDAGPSMVVKAMRIFVFLVVLSSMIGGLRAKASDSLIDRALANPEFAWESLAEGTVRLYYQPGSFAERHRIMLLRSARAALDTGLAFLDQEAADQELRVLYVDDRAQMEELIGHTYSGFADWTGHGVFLVCNPDWRSFDTHEISHILTMGRWGDPVEDSIWMVEGLPVAVDGWCQTIDVDRIAAYLADHGRWPGLSKFLADSRSLGEVPGGIFAASLIRYLREQYGAAIIQEVWTSGLVKTLEAREADPGGVESEWLDRLGDLENPLTEAEWEKIEADGCG